ELAAATAALAAAQPAPTADDSVTDASVDGLDWAAAARGRAAGADQPLTADQAQALGDRTPPGDLADRHAVWHTARAAVLAAFGAERQAEIAAALDDYDTATAFLARLRDNPDGQRAWFDHRAARHALSEFGLEAALDFCADRNLPAAQIRPVLERAALRGWADAVIRADARLHPGHAADRDRLVDEFRALDAALAAAAPGRIADAVNAHRSTLDEAEAGLLRREGMKETRHLAVRDLIGRARNTVLAVKPCFLMSPLAVSQFLPPDIRFDVVIFDEASQVTPADAINCIYRGTALIAAGDDRQLPPTSFFERTADQADDEGDAATDVNDFQSILELAKACGAFRSLALTWHYRSRHEALIAFANHAFYQGRLITFPGADAAEPGVELISAEGVYRKGANRDNPIEAALVADRVVAAFTTRPELSLGVVTFSVAQAEAIRAALERATAKHPGLDRFLDGDRLSGFFVKSLETVQGDERDVMIFSIGYGHDELGRMSTNFGALSQPNGWRRLNVAITRARRRVEIVSSIRARDLADSANESVRHLAAYLDFAERGMDALPVRPGPVAAAGPFERSVLQTVRSWGYEAEAGIGSAAYRLDIGVRHPDRPGWMLGIECDGPMYRSAEAARDRDRLRADVLTGLGWRLHRVWSVAWHRDRATEEARLRALLEELAALGDVPESGPQPYRRVGIRLQTVS
ncbi:MAG: AAA domain-containing protein, partial [Actinoplanes sp.]